MNTKRLIFAVALAFVCMAGMAQNFRANMDPSVKPGDDFWQYAVGTWLKNNPIDKEYPMNGAFVDLEELNKKHINALDAFNIQPTDKMFIPKEKRALVW